MLEAVAAGVPARLCDIASQSATQMGDSLVALFDRIRDLPDKVGWVHRHISSDLPRPLVPRLDRACAAVAAAIDAEAVAFDRQPYHNRQHFCEVALTAYVLCLLNRQDTASTQFVLLAALLHDFVHDGGAHPAFVQERASVECARPLLEAAGLRPADIGRLAALVLATDTSLGTWFMAAASKTHARGDAPPAVPAQAQPLAALLAEPALALQARILCEADILPSMGLSVAHAMHLQERLSREWRRPLGVADKLGFIDGVLRADFIGEFFLPNVQATRRTLAGQVHAEEQG